MGEKMSPNDVEKNGGKIEEYMVRAEKIVDSPNSWCVSDFGGLKGSRLLSSLKYSRWLYQGPI